jgi:GT2 family glycosyltransferase
MKQRELAISVVIRCYTEARWEQLKAAVRSAQTQSHTPHQVIVVVDHNEALEERVRWELSGITVVPNGRPRGSAGAWNSGVAAASGDVIAFLDDDAVALPDWLQELAAPYADPGVAGVGGAILPLWQTGRPGWFPREFDWVVGCTYKGMPASRSPVRNLIGCNMSFRRAAFAAVGEFRSEIGHLGGLPFGGDETEFCIRLRRHWPNTQLIYTPDAVVQHHVPGSRACWGYFVRRCYLEGRSKAVVSQLVGARCGLSSELGYTVRVLPQGIAGGLIASATGQGRTGLLRAAAIACGFALSTTGYAYGRLAGGQRQLAGGSRAARPGLPSEILL